MKKPTVFAGLWVMFSWIQMGDKVVTSTSARLEALIVLGFCLAEAEQSVELRGIQGTSFYRPQHSVERGSMLLKSLSGSVLNL